MKTFTCPECKTVGIISVVDGNYAVSPCDCVAKENN
jgi:hypothetical protein